MPMMRAKSIFDENKDMKGYEEGFHLGREEGYECRLPKRI